MEFLVYILMPSLYLYPKFADNAIDAGDYNLEALDYLPECGLHWVGNCNELNAGMIEKLLN